MDFGNDVKHKILICFTIAPNQGDNNCYPCANALILVCGRLSPCRCYLFHGLAFRIQRPRGAQYLQKKLQIIMQIDKKKKHYKQFLFLTSPFSHFPCCCSYFVSRSTDHQVAVYRELYMWQVPGLAGRFARDYNAGHYRRSPGTLQRVQVHRFCLSTVVYVRIYCSCTQWISSEEQTVPV